MGCIPSSKKLLKPRQLTEKEKTILRTQWSEFREKAKSTQGDMAFMGIFAAHPDSFDLFLHFPFDRINDGKLMDVKNVTLHAVKLTSVINRCIERLDEPDKMVRIVFSIGVRHLEYGVKDKDYIPVMTKHFIKALMSMFEGKVSKETKKAWEIFFDHINYPIMFAIDRGSQSTSPSAAELFREFCRLNMTSYVMGRDTDTERCCSTKDWKKCGPKECTSGLPQTSNESTESISIGASRKVHSIFGDVLSNFGSVFSTTNRVSAFNPGTASEIDVRRSKSSHV